MGNNKKGQPYLPNLEPLLAAGFNPKTGLPVKFGSLKCVLKDDIKKAIRIMDEQDAVNRGTWKNLPANITSQELERMLYYKGQLCFFYDKDLEEFYFMPYALDGTIDFYGRYNRIHPVPMTSGTDDKGDKAQAEYLANKKLNCVYVIKEGKEYDKETSCVLLHDYTKQLSQVIIPRCTVNEPILDVMSECVPFMRTALLTGTGVKAIRVQDADQQANVTDASRSMERAALTGDPFMPIIGKVDMQELTDGPVTKAEEYMLAYQSLDNLRLNTYGLGGGVWEKKAHELQSEADINKSPVQLIQEDATSIRQHFCEVANAIFGTNMSYEPNEIEEEIVAVDSDYEEPEEKEVEENE